MSDIGFIGLGNMGAPMARNLSAAGHRVACHDIVEAARGRAREAGLNVAESAAAAAAGRDVVITMLPDGAALIDVYGAILPHVRVGTVLLDCSTLDVESARKVHRMAARRGLPSVEAPVSGGVSGAVAGTLTFMAGGEPSAFDAVRPLLDIMGRNAFLCGGPGCGQAVKICNNMILGVSIIGVCEALNLAQRLDLDPQRVFDVVSTSSGACWSMNTYCPLPGTGPESPADRDYAAGFTAALMLKDLTLSQRAASEAGAATPMGEAATGLYAAMVESGAGHFDFSAMIRHIRSLSRE